MVWEGKDVVKTGRKMLGATNPLESDPGTIRGDFAIDVGRYALCSTTYNAIFYIHIHIYIYILNSYSNIHGVSIYSILHFNRNICHGSDSVESAEREIGLWFGSEGVQSYDSHSHDWIYE